MRSWLSETWRDDPGFVFFVPAVIVIVAVIMAVAVWTSSGGSTYPSYAAAANAACAGHRGVRSLPDETNDAVCLDGYVAHVNY